MVEKPSPDPFLKNKHWGYLWVNSLKIYAPCFNCITSWGLLKYIKANLQLLPYIKFFKKQKRGLRLVLLPNCLPDFWRKIFLMLYSIRWPNFIVWLPLLRETLANICIIITCWPVCGVMNFEINLIFLIKPFFLHDQRIKTKL